MNAVDTNVLARFVLRDDDAQADQATAMLLTPKWVTLTVWLELGCVLGKQLKLQRDVVADALETLLGLDSIHTADRAGMLWAVERFRAGADWADVIHLVAARDNAEAFSTFDLKLKRHAGAATPVPIDEIT